MDFDYDPYEGLGEFCSNSSLDDKIKNAALNLEEKSEIFNDSVDIGKNFEKNLNLKSRRSLETASKLRECKKKSVNEKITKRKSVGSNAVLKSMEIENEKSEQKIENRRRNQARRKKITNDVESSTDNDINSSTTLDTSKSQLGRARRNFMASLAASLPTEEVIDLGTTEQECNKSSTAKKKNKTKSNRKKSLPKNIIVIGSDSGEDSDYEPIKFKSNILSLSTIDKNDEESNPEVQIIVEWHNKIEKLYIRKYQKFLDILQIFARQEKTDEKDILLNIGNYIIMPDDTIDNINYRFGDIITGRIVKNCQSLVKRSSSIETDTNQICLKIQSNGWKNTIEIKMKKQDTFRILYIKCAETLNLSNKDFLLKFDGDVLIPTKTPIDLDMNEDEVIDCLIKIRN